MCRNCNLSCVVLLPLGFSYILFILLLPVPRTRIYRLFSLFFRASSGSSFLFLPCTSQIFLLIRVASVFPYTSRNLTCTQTCNTGPYESATATHVTSAYRHRNQRISFVMRLTHLFYCVPLRQDFTPRKRKDNTYTERIFY